MLRLLALSIAALQGAALGQRPGPQAGAEKPPCAGLKIGSTPRGGDIVDDGYTLARWAFGRDQDAPVTVGAEVRAACPRGWRSAYRGAAGRHQHVLRAVRDGWHPVAAEGRLRECDFRTGGRCPAAATAYERPVLQPGPCTGAADTAANRWQASLAPSPRPSRTWPTPLPRFRWSTTACRPTAGASPALAIPGGGLRPPPVPPAPQQRRCVGHHGHRQKRDQAGVRQALGHGSDAALPLAQVLRGGQAYVR